MKILVTGGAGYIGSHCVYELIRANHEVVVYDNLSTGNAEAIHSDAIFVKGDIHNGYLLDKVMQEHKFDAVIHFAALIVVPESVSMPNEYYYNNVFGVHSVLEAMRRNNLKNIVFSSTAAVYGTPETAVSTEESLTRPESPYGETKLASERMIHWAANAYGLNYVIFRYFNVAGADKSGEIGLASKITHIIPSAIEAAQGIREQLTVFGNDYKTHDGTCVRDYIHVTDLVKAHILGVEYMLNEQKSEIINLGSNSGFSVLEIVNKVSEVCENVPYVIGDRRPGDPATIVASNEKAKKLLNWNAELDLEEMIKSDYKWRKEHPNGFK